MIDWWIVLYIAGGVLGSLAAVYWLACLIVWAVFELCRIWRRPQ